MELLTDVLRRYHEELLQVEVRIGCTMVRPAKDRDGRPKGPAISKAGVTCTACIWLTTARDRIHMPYEAIIEIDADRWDTLSERERKALLDHEVTHLVLQKDKTGGPVTDDDLRPRLRTRPDEWTLTGFAEVVNRHGESALEWQAIQTLVDRYGQLLFPWGAEKPKRRKAAMAQ